MRPRLSRLVALAVPLAGCLFALPAASAQILNESAKLLASDGAAEDWFGYSVALDGDTAVVGSRFDDDNGEASGSAFVYVRSGGVWTEQAKLTASDGAAFDEFGISVAIDGDTAVVGAWEAGDTPIFGADNGWAYVFVRVGGVWTEQAKLIASDAEINENFGISVAVSGDTVVVGSWHDDDACPSDIFCRSGSAYVFTRSGAVWTQQAKLTASDAAAGDQFGVSVAVDVDTAVVRALPCSSCAGTGSAYVFTRSGGV